jgi:vacuolar-type H+-ATPase subunit H
MALREVFDKIIEAETEGKRIVERAKVEAERILSQGRKEADQIRSRTDSESRVEAERILDAITQSAEDEKRKRMDRAISESDEEIQLDETSKQQAVDAVLRCVCQPKPVEP